jgi:diguanylate cyclase (GGDEF)-like protein
MVTGSLGLKGIVEFRSEIKKSTGRELRLEEVCEAEEKFNIQAPKCGRLTLQLYQLERLHHFDCQDDRFLHKGKWSRTVAELTNRIHDASTRIHNDPACGCNTIPEAGGDGLFYLSLGQISMLVAYSATSNGLLFPDLNVVFPGSKEEVLTASIELLREQIPNHLLFLANETKTSFKGRFSVYEGLGSIQDPQSPSILDNLEDILASGEKALSTDLLTGAGTTRAFKHQLESQLTNAQLRNRPFCLLLIDIDQLKLVNDRFGYLQGNQVLRQFAEFTKMELRATDLLYRIGGDEFAVILPETSLAVGESIAERLRLATTQVVAVDGSLTISIGVGEYPASAQTSDQLLMVTDESLYAAKRIRDYVVTAKVKTPNIVLNEEV